MRILLLHNRYLHPGGEDAVFHAEKALLEREGHRVFSFVEHNARIQGRYPVKAALDAIWSQQTQKRLRALIQKARPNICHFHNTFLRISPAAYYICQESGVPVVQTLHNYRLICPGALLMRDGQVCEDCLGKIIPWPSVAHGCWRGRSQTAVVTTMIVVHRFLKTWTHRVDRYIALTEFARQKFIQGGLPAEKIVVKPNFVYPDPKKGSHQGNYALFVGRLSTEKGVHTLLAAWRKLRMIPLWLVGGGMLESDLQERIEQEQLRVSIMGRQPRDRVFDLMQNARFLVFPSESYEGFPLTLVESFATGLPVIASRLGAMAEVVEHGRTGLLFEPGNAEDLAAQVAWAWTHPQEMDEMGREARREYEHKYTAERNYMQLMDIYRQVLSQ